MGKPKGRICIPLLWIFFLMMFLGIWIRPVSVMAETPSEVIQDGSGIIVYTEAQFVTALRNGSYSWIYLGEDIQMTATIGDVALRENGLVISGISPSDETGTIHQLTSFTSDIHLRGKETNLTFYQIRLLVRNYFGVYRYNGSATFSVTLDQVQAEASQIFYGDGHGSLLIRDSKIWLNKVNGQDGELTEYGTSVRFEGEVSVVKNSTGNSIFYRMNRIEVGENAVVTLDRTAEAASNIRAIFYDEVEMELESGALLQVYSSRGFSDNTNSVTNLTIGDGARAEFHYTGTGSYSTDQALKITGTLSLGKEAVFLYYDRNTYSDSGLLIVNQVNFGESSSFIVLCPDVPAIKSSSTGLSGTGIGSIGYLFSSQIGNVYDTTAHAYVGTEVNYDKWWVQNVAFSLTASGWSGSAPVVTSSYVAEGAISPVAGAPVPETALDSGNFGLAKSGQAAYGVVILGFEARTDITISKQVTGAYADPHKSFTFTLYLKDAQGQPLPEGTQLMYVGGRLVEDGGPVLENGVLTLGVAGEGTFTLQHGQTITLVGVQAAYIQVVEGADATYSAYVDANGDGQFISGNDTGLLAVEGLEMQMDYRNERLMVVPTGISIEDSGAVLMIVLCALSLSGLLGLNFLKKRRKP